MKFALVVMVIYVFGLRPDRILCMFYEISSMKDLREGCCIFHNKLSPILLEGAGLSEECRSTHAP